MKNRDIEQDFVPQHERNYSAEIFVDSAIRKEVETSVETLARSLSGNSRISYERKTVDGELVWVAKVVGHPFQGRTKASALCQVISFWMDRKVFPCGGAKLLVPEGEDLPIESPE